MRPWYYILLFFTVFHRMDARTQTPVTDSLKNKIYQSTSARETIRLITELSEQGISADSLLPFVIMAETLAGQENDKLDRDKVAYVRAAYYIRRNLTDSSLQIIEKLLAKYKSNRDNQSFYLKLLFYKAKILDRANQYTKALTQLMEVIQTAEALNDTLIQVQAKTGIGWVQMEMEQYKEALQWLYKALYTSPDKKFYQNYGALYSNIANTYNALGNADSARHYIDIAIKDARENNNLTFLATALNMQAKIFIDNKQPHLAEAPLSEALEIRKKLDDPFYIVYDMSTLASYYANNNKAGKGIELCLQGIDLAKKSGLTSQLLMIYHSLAENYKAAGQMDKYSTALESIIRLKDSFNNINSSRLLANIQAGIETQKNEKEIMEQRLSLAKKNYWLYGSVIFIVMAMVIAGLVFKDYRRKQKLKMQYALEAEKHQTTIAVIEAEEKERKRIAADLHDNLGAQANALLYGTEQLQQSQSGEPLLLLNNLHYTAKDMLQSLRETVWAMKHSDVKASDIQIRIVNFNKHLSQIFKKIKIIMEGEVPDLVLPSAIALHIILIVQEAVNNAVRHAEANRIIVRSMKSADAWILHVSDNGKGFHFPKLQSEGIGLANMQERARLAGIALNIESDPGRGTAICIEVPLNPSLFK